MAVVYLERHFDRQRRDAAVDSPARDGRRKRSAVARIHRSSLRRAHRNARHPAQRQRTGSCGIAMDLLITFLLIASLFILLGSGVWIGIALAGVAWIGMEFFSSRPTGDAMAVTIWGSASSWTLTALPLFVWMGEIVFRTRLSEDMFKGLAPWLERVPGRLLHTNIIGCTIFAAVSGSSSATCATIGK